MYNIGIITYDYKHLKTQQVIEGLIKKKTCSRIKLYALDFKKRKDRTVLFNHRPNQFDGMHTQELANKYKLEYSLCNTDSNIKNDCEIYIITGAGILSEACVKDKRILNCHPGIIPAMRGLDSFKWAIYEGKEVGNTLHYIDKEVDKGEILAIKNTSVYLNDSLETFASRHYREEIRMLVNYKDFISCKVENTISAGVAHRRMPLEYERELHNKFVEYKYKYSVGEGV